MKMGVEGSGEKAAPTEGLDFDLYPMIADLIGTEVGDVRQNSDLSFVELGGDSVKAIQLVFKLEAMGLPYKAESVMEMENSLDSIADELSTIYEKNSSSSNDDAGSDKKGYKAFSVLESTGMDTETAREDACRQIRCSTDQLLDLVPMTNQQKGLWLGSMKRNGAYIGHWTYRLNSEVEVDKLEDAWFMVLQQTPVLRSRVVQMCDGSIWQAILQASRSDFILHQDPDSIRNDQSGADTIFAKYGSPLIRLCVESASSNVFHLLAHHCIYDRWSMQLILQDVRKVYRGIHLEQRPSYIPFLNPLEDAELDELREGWRELLASADVSRTSTSSERKTAPLASTTIQASVSIPTQSKTTVAVLATAAWSLLCSKHRDPIDSVFGLTLWGRDTTTTPTIEMAFPTFNTLPFPSSVKAEDKVETLLKDTNHKLSQMRTLQRLGTDEISSLHHTARNMCKFSSVLVIQPQLTDDAETGPLLLRDLESYELLPSHQLLVECNSNKQEVSIRMYYDSAILTAEAINPLMSQLCKAIKILSSQPASLLGDVDLLDESDRKQIQRWIRPSDNMFQGSLHEMVLRQASKTPQVTAIWQTGLTMSYEELAQRANQVASIIELQLSQKHNVSGSRNLGVFFAKSRIAIVAMIGILMTGRTYVPLDPSHPQARLDKIIKDAKIPLVLCSPDISSRLQNAGCEKLEIDSETLENIDSHDSFHQNTVTPEDSAYMIYTSGSTGAPKGVVISHGAICTSVRALAKGFKFDSNTRTFQFSSFAWDASCHDIWVTLSTGGVICLPTEEERLEPSEFLQKSKVNYGMLTTTVASAMPADAIKCFSRVVLTGEPVTSAVLHRWVSPEREVMGAYGPTETTIVVLLTTFPSPDANPKNLGYAHGATTWIVDENDANKLAPIGCVGELVTSGHVLAKGYWQDEAKTNRAFLEDLKWFNTLRGTEINRVYLSGDLVCYSPDGSLQYVGRKGGYTKIAGNRVDLGEIEHALYAEGETFRDISLQVSRLSTDARARDILICFIKSQHTSRTGACQLVEQEDEVRKDIFQVYQSLRYQLASYMIPSLFVTVNYIPIMSSGKVDARLLKDMVQSVGYADLQRRYGLPDFESSGDDSDETETDATLDSRGDVVSEAWSACLGLPKTMLKASSHFFRMGGDSVAAMRVSAHLREHGVTLHVSDIFRAPNLSEMAACIHDSDEADHVDLQPDPFTLVDPGTDLTMESLIKTAAAQMDVSETSIEDMFPCSPLQMQMLVASERTPGAYIHREVFRLSQDINDDDVEKACRGLIDGNPMLRSRAFIVEETGEFLQVTIKATDVPTFSSYETRSNSGKDISTPALGMRKPLCLFTLQSHSKGRQLVWEMHHAIYDGHSHSLLMKQFHQHVLQDDARLSASTNPSSKSPPFQAFIAYLNAVNKEKSRRFWQGYLDGAERMISPIFNRSGKSTTDSKIISMMKLNWNTSQFTPATYLKTAYALTLANYAGSDDLVYGETFHGRDAALPGIDQMVGPTFATIPARVKFDREKDIESLLGEMQRDSASRTLHQQLPIDEINSLGTQYQKVTQFDTHFLVQTVSLDSSYESLEQIGYTRVTNETDMNLAIPLSIAVIMASKDTIKIEAIFDSCFVPNEQVELLLDQYKATLSALLTADMSTTIRNLSPLGPNNARKIMSVQSSTRRKEPFSTIPNLLFSDLEKRGSREALYSSTKSYTYKEMYKLALTLVSRIKEVVGTPNQLVAVCLDKSPISIVCQLAVMMSGHGYVTLDPSHPSSRHQHILSQTKCALLFVSPRYSKLFEDIQQQKLVIDANNDFGSIASQDQNHEPPTPKDVAYITYTSGSTGEPKGVVVEHKSICITMQEYAKRLTFGADTRAVLFAAYTFDASIMETWAILAAGGCLLIPSEDERVSNLDQFITDARADVVCLTPSSAMLVDPSRHKNLKTLLLCGEKCKRSDIQRWENNDTVLVNAYGPTEASVCAIMNNTVRSSSSNDDIGQSLHAGVWIMDPDTDERHLPVGSIGELCLSGDTLARGYLEDPIKTADKFVSPKWPDWTRLGDQRVYKTGDLAWIDVQGRVHYVGRKDNQLKVNGIRIEAGEIETTVTDANFGVHQAIAMTYNCDGTENGSLALFFVRTSSSKDADHRHEAMITAMTKDDHSLICNLDRLLRDTLPPASIPNVYLPLTRVPTNTSSKIDKKLLISLVEDLHPSQTAILRPDPSPAQQQSDLKPQTNGHQSPPQTSENTLPNPTEKKLAELWSSVFRRPTSAFNRSSHFVQSGGDSIIAIRLSALARSRGLNLPAGIIYGKPVLADMAMACEEKALEQQMNNAIKTPEPLELLDGVVFSPATASPMEKEDYFGKL